MLIFLFLFERCLRSLQNFTNVARILTKLNPNEIFNDFPIFQEQVDRIDSRFFYFKGMNLEIIPDPIGPNRTNQFHPRQIHQATVPTPDSQSSRTNAIATNQRHRQFASPVRHRHHPTSSSVHLASSSSPPANVVISPPRQLIIAVIQRCHCQSASPVHHRHQPSSSSVHLASSSSPPANVVSASLFHQLVQLTSLGVLNQPRQPAPAPSLGTPESCRPRSQSNIV